MDASTPEGRSELIRRYKESYRPHGIFRLTHQPSGKAYVGSTRNLPAVVNKLRMQLSMGSFALHPQLQSDWTRDGEEAFVFDVVAELEAPEEPGWDPTDDLEALLQLWLDDLKPWGERGYNRPPK